MVPTSAGCSATGARVVTSDVLEPLEHVDDGVARRTTASVLLSGSVRVHASVAELADALGLGPSGLHSPWGFESPRSHRLTCGNAGNGSARTHGRSLSGDGAAGKGRPFLGLLERERPARPLPLSCRVRSGLLEVTVPEPRNTDGDTDGADRQHREQREHIR